MIKPEVTVLDKDLGYDRLSKALAEVRPTTSMTGLIRGKADPEVIQYAAANEFGVEREKRPWMRKAFDENVVTYGQLLISSLDEFLQLKDLSAINRGFTIVASIAEQDQREMILNWPPTQENPDPLYETGTMVDSLDIEVKEKGEVFKPADTRESTIRAILRGSGIPSRRGKRKRRSSLRTKARGLLAIAKSPGYSGRGIRGAPSKRRNAASGVASRGVRRK